MTTRNPTDFYSVAQGSDEQRDEVREALPELDLLSAELAGAATTAWVTAWQSSPHPRFAEIPMAIPTPRYSLARHTRDVAIAGLALADIAGQHYGRQVDRQILLATLLLHDLDSPLIYEQNVDGALAYSERGSMLQHGVLGAMILRDVGVPDGVVSLVATHAVDSPFHRETPEAWVLYYADLFAADHAILKAGGTPIYRRKK